MDTSRGAEVLVANLEAQGVTRIFGIPGAKIDPVFDALADSSIETIVCRHEQNAAFIAQGLGRLTGKAGVCIVTSGPGATNLGTGVSTANAEGAPLVCFGGSVPLASRLKASHQNLDAVSFFEPITKYSAEVDSPNAIGESVANAFRAAEGGRPGASFVSLPSDVMAGDAPDRVLTPVSAPALGAGSPVALDRAAELIEAAAAPVLLLGMMASDPRATDAIARLMARTRLPCVSTYQATGVVAREHGDLFAGQVGLFHNQPADRLLDHADVVITIGYDPIEYDEQLWNADRTRPVIHIDVGPCDIDAAYRPAVEVVGDIGSALDALCARLGDRPDRERHPLLDEVRSDLDAARRTGAGHGGMPLHPMRIIAEVQKFVRDDVTIAMDMGSFHIWHARYLETFRPRQMLISNGQQTLGVALPWAIAASIARPDDTVLSVSGDGGFLFSAVELETAVRLGCNFVHMIWRDGAYDMVAFQEQLKYGRVSGVDFGPVDVPQFAASFGAKGYVVNDPDDLAPILREAIVTEGPVLIDIPVDYSHNAELGRQIHPDVIH